MRIAAHRNGGIAGVLAQWGPLVLCLAAAFVAGQRVPRWGYMWLLAGALVAGMKWATVHAYGAVHPSYMWLWPGMDAGRFHEAPERTPAAREGLAACTRVLAGALLVWAVAPRLQGGLATAWAGLIGLGLVVHFGLLHLLSVVLRLQGFDAQPLFDRPTASRSVGEFWGRRWNRAFADVAGRWIYRPLAPLVGPRRAVLAVFLTSGVVHDMLLSVPAGGGYGLCTLYFALQAAGMLLLRGRRRWVAVLVVVLPLPLLFHPVFMRAVLLPFLAALGASS